MEKNIVEYLLILQKTDIALYESFVGKKFICHICSKIDKLHSSKCNLKMHIKSIHEGVYYTCDICGKKCSQMSNLKKHIHSQHSNTKLKCGIEGCPYEHKNRDYLSQHRQIFHFNKKPKCTNCNATFSKFSTNYRKHLDNIPKMCKNKSGPPRKIAKTLVDSNYVPKKK